ncbi:MAG: polysaccharide biosynthesis tyrosine autokinase [Waterburya sp.]
MIPTVVSNTYEEQIDFQKYWLVLKRRWLPATVIFVGVTSLFVLSALSKEPTYEAEAELLIRTDESSKLVGLEDERGKIEALGKDSNPIVTEAEILKSRPIIEAVIKQLNLQNDQGKLLNYQAIASNLDVKPLVGTAVLQVFYQDTDPELAAAIVNKVIDLYVQEDTLNNRSEAAAARQFIKGQLPKIESTVAKAEADLRQFKTENRISNLSQEASNRIDTIESLENQIDQVNVDLKDINSRLEQLGSRLNISWEEAVAISSLGGSAVPQLISELQKVRIDLVNQRDRFSENAPQVISLKEREVELETLLNNQIEKIYQGDQQLSSLKSKILNISAGDSDQSIISQLANMGVERTGLLNKLAALKSNLQARQQNLKNLPLLEEQQRELDRRVQATQSTYQTLLSQLQQTQVAENQNVGNVRIIANAVVPEQPTGSSKEKLLILIGSAMGALLGVASAFLLDFNDRSIKNSKEAEDIFGYPLQGVIPNLNQLGAIEDNDSATAELQRISGTNHNSLVTLKDQQFDALKTREAYQMLQANLKLLNTDWDRKAIAITSCVPQEGKSQVANNFARSLAQLGKQVLLIDADMRRPSQHIILGLSNSIGLSNLLVNQMNWQDAVQGITPNLDVLTAGVVLDPEDSVSLLNSQRMKILTKTLLNSYDCIIVDTPPLIGMADTVVLGSMVDGLLLVVRPGVVDYESAIAVKRLLVNTEQHVLGIVANGVDVKNQPYSKSYS